MTFTLGAMPLTMSVVLTPDADFTSILRNSAGNWATGIAVELRFNDTPAPPGGIRTRNSRIGADFQSRCVCQFRHGGCVETGVTVRASDNHPAS